MSRQLPVRPNLDHLKKQAKALLDQMRLREPSAQLADAQHALAREYGFSTWPRLKTHVLGVLETAAPSPFAGHWVSSLSRSTLHPLNSGQRGATLEITVEGDTVTIVDFVTDAAGRIEQRTNTLRVDGDAHQFSHGYRMRATWDGPRAIATVATQDGREVGRGRYEVAADGQTLTVISPDQRVVFDRG